MSLQQKIPRNLEDQVKILGLSPIELATCALSYSIISPFLSGVPFSALLSLIISFGIGLTLMILNRTYPPQHGLFYCLKLFRPKLISVMAFGLKEKKDERVKLQTKK